MLFLPDLMKLPENFNLPAGNYFLSGNFILLFQTYFVGIKSQFILSL